MSGAFFDSFNVSLPDMEAQFTEDWTFKGAIWPAIAIDNLDIGSKTIRGGQMIDAHTSIIVRDEVFLASGVEKGAVVTARGIEMTVLQINSDGDASKVLVCGPAGINVWR